MKNLDVIRELYYSYISKRQKAYELVVSNETEISELEEFLNSVDLQDVDLKFFSPHSSSEIYEGKIEANRSRLEVLRNENEIQNQLIEELDFRIAQFKEMLLEEEASEVDSINNIEEESEDSNGILSDVKVSNSDLTVLDIFEKERHRISTDLHDTAVQNLVHLIHSVELSSLFIDSDPIRAKLELQTCIKNIQETIDIIRETIFNLRPMSFDDLGFKRCIDDYLDNMRIYYPEVSIVREIDDINLDSEIGINVFRIVQECIINALKHSKSDRIYVKIYLDNDALNISVEDSGIGFNIDDIDFRKHFGISILKERVEILNGSLDINSSSNGTQINVVIPEIKGSTYGN